LYDYSKRYLDDNTTFIEVGCWNGGASALVALANKNKKMILFYAIPSQVLQMPLTKTLFLKEMNIVMRV
jgi:hypothetical protein